jgi:hypothetical protein
VSIALAGALALLVVAVALPAPDALAAPKDVFDDYAADGIINEEHSLDDLTAARDEADPVELEYSTLGENLDRAIAETTGDKAAVGGSPSLWIWMALAAMVVAAAGAVATVARRRAAIGSGAGAGTGAGAGAPDPVAGRSEPPVA